MVKNGCDVVGVVEPAGTDQLRQKNVDVVMVRFRPAQFCGEWPERVGGENLGSLGIGEAGVLDESGPAVELSGSRDGLVFGSQLSNRAPCLLLGRDRLVSR